LHMEVPIPPVPPVTNATRLVISYSFSSTACREKLWIKSTF
jgi:hypothetical protein